MDIFEFLGITREEYEREQKSLKYSDSDLFRTAIWDVKREFIDILADYNPNIIQNDNNIFIEEYTLGEMAGKYYDPMCDTMSICITRSKKDNSVEGIMLRTWFLDSRNYEAFGFGYENYECKYIYTKGNGVYDIKDFDSYTKKAKKFLNALLKLI